MSSLLDLANDLDNLLTRVGAMSKQVVDDVALSVLNDLVQSTPADVGTALSNWQLTLDAPAADSIPAFAPSPRGKVIDGVWTHTVDPSFTAQANIPAVLDSAKLALSARAIGQTVFISNNLPYIQRLNEGDSTQAPAGFVDRAVILGQQAVARAKL
jgi:hypothetical protein